MMEELRIYGHGETDFTGNGLAILQNAYEVAVNKEINESWTLDFKLPPGDPKLQYVTQNAIVVCEGQQYRVSSLELSSAQSPSVQVKCEHIFFAAAKAKMHPQIPTQEVITNQTGTQILTLALAGTGITVLPDNEDNKVTKTTDFFRQSKITAWDTIKKMLDWIGEGELDIDNRTVRFVKYLGKDLGKPLNASLNLKSLKLTEDGTIVNRLYALGPNDMPLPLSTAPHGYIDDVSSQAAYGVVEGTLSFDDIYIDDDSKIPQAQNVLLAKAQWQFDPQNPNRISYPRKQYDVAALELYKIYGDQFAYALGDSVHLVDETVGADVSLRIIKMQYYPLEPTGGSITLGQRLRTMRDVIKEGISANTQLGKDTGATGQISHIGLSDNAVDTNNLRADAVTAEKITAGAIETEKLAAGAVTADKIQVDELSAITANLGTVNAGSITSETTIDVTTDLTVGRNIQLNCDNFTDGIHFMPNGKGSITVDDFATGRLHINAGLSVNGSLTAPTLYVAAKDIVAWLNDLESRVTALENAQ